MKCLPQVVPKKWKDKVDYKPPKKHTTARLRKSVNSIPLDVSDEWNRQAEEYLAERYTHQAPKTYRDSRRYIKMVRKYFGTGTPTPDVVGKAKLAMVNDNLSVHVRNVMVNHCKGFMRWRTERGYLDKFYPINIPPLKFVIPVREPITRLEWEKIQRGKRFKWPVNYLCTLAWFTGMRISDIMTLRWAGLDEENRTISYMPYKLRFRCPKIVSVPYGDEVALMFVKAQRQLHKADGSRGEYIVPHLATEMQSPTQSRAAIQDVEFLFKEVGVRKTFHCFRHSFITRQVDNGTPIHVIADIVGVGLNVIQNYTHVSMATKRRAIENQ